MGLPQVFTGVDGRNKLAVTNLPDHLNVNVGEVLQPRNSGCGCFARLRI